MQTLEVLLRRRGDVFPDLAFAEPYFGNTPLHSHAKEGHQDVVIRLLEAGAPAANTNQAGRTPVDELRADIDALDRETDPASVERRSKLHNTLQVMEISLIAN